MINFTATKLKDRILWGYSIPIMLSVGAAILVFFNVKELGEKAKELNNSNAVVIDLKDLQLGFSGMQKSARGYFLSKDNSDFLTEYNENVKIFDQFYQNLLKRTLNPKQYQRLTEINALQDQIDEGYKQAFSLFNQGKQDEGLNLWKTQVVPQLRQVEVIAEEFQNTEQELLIDKHEEQNQSLDFLITVVMLSTTIAALIAILIALWIASGIAEKMSQSTNMIVSSSREIAATVEQQERIASQQAVSVNQTTSTMDELGASSQQSATQAQDANKSAQQALALTEVGSLAVQETLELMTILQQKVEAIAEQIKSLNEQANQISNISNIVTDLANQTNMLALNAAVESVRAGENGKGFAVIATEIRKLSDESKKSTQNIDNLVIAIKNALDSTVAVTIEGTKTVESGSKITQKMVNAFSGVADAVNNVLFKNQQISQTAQQQAIAIQQVVDAMNVINQSTQEAAIGITQTKIGTQQLNQVAQNLNSMI